MKTKNIAIGDFVQVKKSICHIELEAEEICEVIDIDRVYKQGFDVLIQGKSGLYRVNHKDLKKPIKREPEPQLKKLTQSVFDGVDEKWKFAAVNVSGALILSTHPIEAMSGSWVRKRNLGKLTNQGLGYDTTNWQNSLIKRESKPQLKQLDHSVFDGVFNWVKSAAVNPNGSAYLFSVGKDDFYNISEKHGFQITGRDKCQCIGLGYDTTNWRNSLIERDTATELTGSELCKAMLARGDKYVLCIVSPYRNAIGNDSITIPKVVTKFHEYGFITTDGKWAYAIPINNQGEPLTSAEAGF